MIEFVFILILIMLLVRHLFFWKARTFNINIPKFMAHRGMKIESPENTIESFKEAIKHGFKGVELDIILTKDGELICSHNYDLERETNGQGWIHKINLNELDKIKTGIYSHPNNSQALPTFLEILSEIPSNIFLNIEIKTLSLFDLSTTKSLIKLIKSEQIKHSFIILTFNPIVVGYFRLFSPSVSIGYLIEDITWLWTAHLFHPDYLHPRADLVDQDIFGMCKRHNLTLNVWTVNTIPAIRWCKKNHISGIITDNPMALHV